MNTETMARAAGDDLREHTAVVDPEHGLASLLVAHAHRRRTTRAALAVAAVAAVVLAWWGDTRSVADRPATPQPAHSGVCPADEVTCLGHRTYRFALDTPVSWRIPPGYGVNSGAGASSSMVESYGFGRNDGEGVTVMEGVRPAPGGDDGSAPRHRSAGSSTVIPPGRSASGCTGPRPRCRTAASRAGPPAAPSPPDPP